MEVYKKHPSRGWVAFQFISGEMWPVCDCLFFLTSSILGKGDCEETGHERAAKRYLLCKIVCLCLVGVIPFQDREGCFKTQGTKPEDSGMRVWVTQHIPC